MQPPYSKSDTIFVDGMIFRKPGEGTPEFVKGKLSIKVPEFVAFAKKHQQNGWLNIDLKKSQKGTLYLALNNFKPKSKNGGEDSVAEQPKVENTEEDEFYDANTALNETSIGEDMPF